MSAAFILSLVQTFTDELDPSRFSSLDPLYPSIDVLLQQGTFLPLLARALLFWQLLGDDGMHTPR